MVSRQLQAPEAQLGTSLIAGKPKRMQLTPDGLQYEALIRRALQTISSTSMDLPLILQGCKLELVILPTFEMPWQVPRLADFTRRYPNITISMATRLRLFYFAYKPFDVALHFDDVDFLHDDHL